MKNQNEKIRNMVFAALCVAIGLALPQAMHSIPEAGRVFLPMHIPVLLCGLLCGSLWGFGCGLLTPILSSLLFSMPPAPYLPGMVLELATYGLVAGLLYRKFKLNVYVSLVSAMILGRVVYGLMNAAIFLSGGNEYSLAVFFTSLFIKALPGIVIQIALLPLLVIGLEKAGVVLKPKSKQKKQMEK